MLKSSAANAFLEFTNMEGNRAYVRIASVAAIHHDGRRTVIALRDVLGTSAVLVAAEMPQVLFKQIAEKTAPAA